MPNPTFVSQVMAALGRLRLFATAALPSSPPTGQLVYDTTADALKVANNAGTFATVGSGGGVTVGAAVVGGGANRVLFEDGAQNIGTDANFTYTAAAGLVLGANVFQVPDGAKTAPAIRSATVGNGFYFGSNFFAYANSNIAKTFVQTTTGFGLASDMPVTWCSNTDAVAAAADTGFSRAAAGVIDANLGTAGTSGWLRNRAGELALNAPYTNATAGFTATNLSATVISGRTYSFECILFFSDSTAADGAQFDFNGGSAGVTNFMAQAFAFNNVGAALAITNGAVTALATAIQVTLALTSQTMLVVKGTLVPSGNGTFIVRAAQTAHSTGTLTVNRGSYLNIRDSNPL